MSYEDDPSIPDHSLLYRRVPTQPNYYQWDANRNCFRPTSLAFRDDGRNNAPMSVHLGVVLDEMKLAPSELLKPFPSFALASIPVELARQLHQKIVRNPVEDDAERQVVCGAAHGLVVGEKRKADKAMALGATWAVPPTSTGR